MSTILNQGINEENKGMENLEMFHVERDPLEVIIQDGQDALMNDVELRDAILVILGQASNKDERLSILTNIGLNANNRCFALCEAVRDRLEA